LFRRSATPHGHVVIVDTVSNIPAIMDAVSYRCLVAYTLYVVQLDLSCAWTVSISQDLSFVPVIHVTAELNVAHYLTIGPVAESQHFYSRLPAVEQNIFHINVYRLSLGLRQTHWLTDGPLVGVKNSSETTFASKDIYPNVTTLRSSQFRLSVVCPSAVTFVHPTQPVEISDNISMPFCNTATLWPPYKILRRLSQGNPSVWGKTQEG